MSRRWSRVSVWVWLARLSADTNTRKVVRWVLVLGALGLFGLGFWGWTQYNDQEEVDVEISFLTAVYRSVSFFTGEAAEPYDVPWQLQVARIFALVVVGFSVFVGIAQFMTEFFMTRGAKRASDHFVLLGPEGSPEDVLTARHLTTAGETTVQTARESLDDEQRRRLAGTDRITVQDDLASDSWLGRTGALTARLVVLSGGSDRQTMRWAFTLLDAFDRSESHQPAGAHVIVDLHRWETAQWFDLLVARKHPGVSLEAGSTAEAAIVERVIQRLHVQRGHTSPQAPGPTLAVAGRGESRDNVVQLLERHLNATAVRTMAKDRLPLLLTDLGRVEGDDGDEGDNHRVRRTTIGLAGPSNETSPLHHALVFVVDDDEDRSNQLELQLSARFPSAEVISMAADDLRPTSTPDFQSLEGLHILRGPVWRLAKCLLADDERAGAGGTDQVVDQDRIRAARSVVHDLGGSGFQIVAIEGGSKRADLSKEQATALIDRLRTMAERHRCIVPQNPHQVWNLQTAIRKAGYDFDDAEDSRV